MCKVLPRDNNNNYVLDNIAPSPVESTLTVVAVTIVRIKPLPSFVVSYHPDLQRRTKMIFF